MKKTGSCVCGGVSYSVDGQLRDVINCHCERCRRHTGHFMAATSAEISDITINGPTLQWYSATPDVGYGFCGECGSTMFWRSAKRPETISIAAGTLDPPTGLVTVSALFVDDASDYHTLQPGLVVFGKDH